MRFPVEVLCCVVLESHADILDGSWCWLRLSGFLLLLCLAPKLHLDPPEMRDPVFGHLQHFQIAVRQGDSLPQGEARRLDPARRGPKWRS